MLGEVKEKERNMTQGEDYEHHQRDMIWYDMISPSWNQSHHSQINHSINHSFNQSIIHSINQSINHSIIHSLNHSLTYLSISLSSACIHLSTILKRRSNRSFTIYDFGVKIVSNSFIVLGFQINTFIICNNGSTNCVDSSFLIIISQDWYHTL